MAVKSLAILLGFCALYVQGIHEIFSSCQEAFGECINPLISLECGPGEHSFSLTGCGEHRCCVPDCSVLNGQCQGTCAPGQAHVFNPGCPTSGGVPVNNCCISGSGTGGISGDPHFKTFDGLLHHFQGLSGVWYTAVQILPLEGKGQTMKLEIQTKECSGVLEGTFQCLDAVRLLFDDVVVSHINTHGPIQQRVKDGHGGLIVANYSDAYYKLTFEAKNITHVTVRNGFQYWVRGMWMKVEVPQRFQNSVSGLLGTFNDDLTDDLTSQNGGAIPYDKHAVEQFIDAKASVPVQQFGHSWISRNMTGGLGHGKKFGVQSDESFRGALIVNHTKGDVSNSVKDRCQTLVMETLQQKCGHVERADAERLMTTCQYDLHACPDCHDMLVEETELHCH